MRVRYQQRDLQCKFNQNQPEQKHGSPFPTGHLLTDSSIARQIAIGGHPKVASIQKSPQRSTYGTFFPGFTSAN